MPAAVQQSSLCSLQVRAHSWAQGTAMLSGSLGAAQQCKAQGTQPPTTNSRIHPAAEWPCWQPQPSLDAAPVRQRRQHRQAVVAAGGLAIMPPLRLQWNELGYVMRRSTLGAARHTRAARTSKHWHTSAAVCQACTPHLFCPHVHRVLRHNLVLKRAQVPQEVLGLRRRTKRGRYQAG